MKYFWDDFMPKLASKERMTDVNFDRDKSSTPFSDMLGFATLSDRKSAIELKTDKPTPLSSQMGWPLLGGTGEAHVQLTTADPYPLSSRMGWRLLSDRKYYGVAAHQQ